jgi:flagellar motor switch protein FliN
VSAGPIEQLAHDIAESCSSRLGDGAAVAQATAQAFASAEWGARDFPAVAATLALSGETAGESVVVLAPESARALVAILTPESPLPDGELGAEQLQAIGVALDTLLAGSLGAEPALAPAVTTLLHDASELPATGLDAWVVSYTLEHAGRSIEIVQTLPAALGAPLAFAIAVAAPAAPDAGPAPDEIGLAVERAAALAADATADVLSTLFSEELSAATPAVEATSGDPLATLEYPLIVAEVGFLTGLEGANRFVLRPVDAAKLAAAMMGTPETTGDGLSAIELSAVSEAMNQVMGATVSELSKALGIDVEVAPPACVVVDSAEQARETMGPSAYRASFRLVSTIFSAEIVQLVSPELAASLGAAFASHALAQDAADSLDDAFGAFAEMPLTGFAAVTPEPLDARGGARELLSGIRVRVSAELGRSRMPIARVANMPAGSIVVLDRAPSDPVDVLVNGTPFAQARVVLVDGEYAVQIIRLSPLELNG